MSIPTGAQPPAPDDRGRREVVHAIDGDGSAVCGAEGVEPVGHDIWADAPVETRCRICQAILGS